MPAPAPRTAADVMTTSIRTCSPFSTVLEAVMLMRDADCGAVPIIDDGKPIGILTDRDVALAVTEFPDLAQRSVDQVMTKGVTTIPDDATIEELLAAFTEHRVRRLVVVNDAQIIVGIVTWADIAHHQPEETLGQVVADNLGPA